MDHGALFVDASAIRVAESAPFIPEEGFIAAVQQGLLNRGKTLREKDNYHLICRPPVTKLTDGMRLFFRTPVTNTGSCTLRVDDFPPYPVFDDSSKELSKSTLSICHQNEVEWNAALNAWILCNHQQQIDWDDVDKRYIPVSGGEVKGPLRVEGWLSTGMALKVGKSEITTEGDISGKVWNGSLLNWFMNRAARFVKDDDSSFLWKDPVSKLIIQGGNYRSKGGNVSYNTTFPNKCFVVLITQSGKRGMSKDNSHVDEVTIFGFNLHAGKGEPSFYWLAIGY